MIDWTNQEINRSIFFRPQVSVIITQKMIYRHLLITIDYGRISLLVEEDLMYNKREIYCDCIISTGGDSKAAPSSKIQGKIHNWIYAETRSRFLLIKLDFSE